MQVAPEKRKKNRPGGKSHQEQQQQQCLPSFQLPGRRQAPSLLLPRPLPSPWHALSSALPMPCRAKRCRATRTRFKGCQLPIEAVKYAKQFDSQRDCVCVWERECVYTSVCVREWVCVQHCDIYCCFLPNCEATLERSWKQSWPFPLLPHRTCTPCHAPVWLAAYRVLAISRRVCFEFWVLRH